MKKISTNLPLLATAFLVCVLFVASPATAASGSTAAVAQPAASPQAALAKADAPAVQSGPTSRVACNSLVSTVIAPVPQALQTTNSNCVQYSTRQECQDLCDCGLYCKKTCVHANCCCTCP